MMKIYTTIFLLMIPLVNFSQDVRQEIRDQLDEYELFVNVLADRDISEESKDDFISGDITDNLFLHNRVRVYNDLGDTQAGEHLSLTDYANRLRKLKGYETELSLHRVIQLKEPKGKVDVVVYINKLVPAVITKKLWVKKSKGKMLVLGFNKKETRNKLKLKIVMTQEYQDSDEDGIIDWLDECPYSERFVGQKVNDKGCIDEDEDDHYPDADPERGISYDPDDDNPCVPSLETSSCDTDEDGIPDNRDQCPKTAKGRKVNKMGCTDYDGDGLYEDVAKNHPKYDSNDHDSCVPENDTPNCDSDGDKVANRADLCHYTVRGATVNAYGCTDVDGDGYYPDMPAESDQHDPNDKDPCIPRRSVKACDCDSDGIPDAEDNCRCLAGVKCIRKGCNGCPDDDKDGLCNKHDACKTVFGKKRNGCPKQDVAPMAKWSFMLGGGVSLPLFDFARADLLDITDLSSLNQEVGLAQLGYSTEIGIQYAPTNFLSFGLNINHFWSFFNINSFVNDTQTFLAARENQLASYSIKATSYQYFYPNFSMALGYFGESKFFGFALRGEVGVLTDELLSNKLEGELTVAGLGTGRFDLDLSLPEPFNNPLYSGSLSLYFNFGGNDKHLLELKGRYLDYRYPVAIRESFSLNSKPITFTYEEVHLQVAQLMLVYRVAL